MFVDPVEHGLLHVGVALALLDAFVDAVFDEDLDERQLVQLVEQAAPLGFELSLERLEQILGVGAQHRVDVHLDRPIAVDRDHTTGQRDLAGSVGVQRLLHFFRVLLLTQRNLDLDRLGRVVVDRADLEALLLGRRLDRSDQRVGGHTRSDRTDRQPPRSGHVDLRTDADAALAGSVLRRVHQPALLEIGEYPELFFVQDRNLRLQQLDEIVREDPGGQPDRDPLGPQHQQQRKLGR